AYITRKGGTRSCQMLSEALKLLGPLKHHNLKMLSLKVWLLKTLLTFRKQSASSIYYHSWDTFDNWCKVYMTKAKRASVLHVLEFLQDRLTKSLGTFKIQVSAIASIRGIFLGVPFTYFPFSRAVLLKPCIRSRVPTWDLMVLSVLSKELLQSIQSSILFFL
uniref:Uncharacterized protein n=1 Tax=Latimeria chalumnae TaxID=7897 RepID=H3AXU7_LATCH